MILETVFTEGLAQISYLVGCDSAGVAAVIDPRRDADVYLSIAQRVGVRITHILETHIHADFVSGSRELAARTGAEICVGRADNYGFEHRPLEDGDTIPLGAIRLVAMHTPGHTPEHMSFVASSQCSMDRPWAVFTGDTLFVGEVGRPDLLGRGKAVELAGRLHHSLFMKLMALPDDVIIYPGHGEGSPCGGNIGDRRTSTIGYERRNNARLLIKDEDEFTEKLLASMPPAPTYYPRMKKVNAEGPKVLGTLPEPPLLSPHEFAEAICHPDARIIDTRSILGFGGGHIKDAISIELREEFPIWAGWLVDPEKTTLLVLRDRSHLDLVVRHLVRIGCEKIGGYLRDMRSWQESGLPLEHLRPMYVQELKEALEGGEQIQLVDVRRRDEFSKGHLPGAMHMFVPEIPLRMPDLNPELPIVTYCGTGFRSSIAASILQRLGCKDVRNVPGSFLAWRAAGYEVVA
jgi:hydroxyacylglutathione hydrolase